MNQWVDQIGLGLWHIERPYPSQIVPRLPVHLLTPLLPITLPGVPPK